jgi:hypothetical protein
MVDDYIFPAKRKTQSDYDWASMVINKAQDLLKERKADHIQFIGVAAEQYKLACEILGVS